MPQLLIELFSEEIPARMQVQAARDLDRMVRERLAAAVAERLDDPALRARLSDPLYGMTLMPLGSEKFLEFIQNELRVWGPVIKAGNIQIG
jgi:hypothetical protein